MRKKLLGILTGVGFAMATTSANAIPITFDLTDTGLSGGGYSSSAGGIGLVASAYGDYDPTNSIGSSVTYDDVTALITQDTSGSNRGLGVNSTLSDASTSAIDGEGGSNEAIEFVFDQPVELVSVLFNRWGSGDDFDFILDGTLTLNEVDQSNSNWTWTPGANYTGTAFGFGADGSSDQYQIREITVASATVPEPGTMSLLGLGLAGFGLIRRKRKTA